MSKLKRYELTSENVLKYIEHILDKTNTLSSLLLSLTDFTRGCFFTLLPENVNIQRLYEFEAGGLLPQEPEQEYDVLKEVAFSLIPTIQDEISCFILQEAIKNKRVSCIFDDIMRSIDSPYLDEFLSDNLIYTYGEELYYVINNKNINVRSIRKCIEKSNAIWHSVCVLTMADFDEALDHTLTLEQISEICRMSALMMVGAYDGEAYIFWEKN